MGSELMFHEKLVREDQSIIEMKIWKVRKSSHYPLGVRYSLFWVKNGKIIVGYDNHFPKGPHRHYGSHEEEYDFSDVDQLILDFRKDIERDSS